MSSEPGAGHFTMRWWEKVLVLCVFSCTFRLDRLVAQTPSWDLFVYARDLLLWAFSPSLGDCPGVPNSRWQWDVALPSCGEACARPRRGGVGAAKDCRQRS